MINKVSSTMPTVVPSLQYGLSDRVTRKHPKWRNQISDHKSDGRFWIGTPEFPFEYPSNHTSISFSFGDVCMWRTDGQTDNADHYYS